MIKIGFSPAYEKYDFQCDACGRYLGEVRYEVGARVHLDKVDIHLCKTCATLLGKKLTKIDPRSWELSD